MTVSVNAMILAASALVMVGSAIPAFAQNPPGTHQDNGGLNGSLSRDDLQKLSGDHKQGSSADTPKDPAQARAKAMAQSAPVLQSVAIMCELSDARLVASGTSKAKSGGKEVETRIYEAACSGAPGYLLVTQGTERPIAMSCLNAEVARLADVAKGREPSFFCKLPENKDVNRMVASMIAADTGASCEVRTLQSFGHSESTHSDYTEVACVDGSGFMLRMAQPGSQSKNVAMSCGDAAKQGIKCRMTDSGPVETPVTLQTFKEALAQNGVACGIGQVRWIGQEDHLKRYVVEYVCADQSSDRIAFIPLAGNSTPYESLDCATALATRGVACTLMPPK